MCVCVCDSCIVLQICRSNGGEVYQEVQARVEDLSPLCGRCALSSQSREIWREGRIFEAIR